MAKLSRVTRAAVEEALHLLQEAEGVAEFQGRRFQESKLYFLRHEGKLYDTKPLIAAAYGIAVPEEGPLSPEQLSGGAKHSAGRLKKLQFDIVTPAILRPPVLGDQHDNRTAVASTYGGSKIPGILTFPGDSVVNVFSDADGPYADDPPTLTASFGYRGEGLRGPQRLSSRGNQLLEKSRLGRVAVRFWYRPLGGRFTFVSWVAILGRAWEIGFGDDGLERPEIVWQLQAVGGSANEEWPTEVLSAIEDSADDKLRADAQAPEAYSESAYVDLLNRVVLAGQSRRADGVIRVNYFRSSAARRAVLVRAAGVCESERCTGMPSERTRQGDAILDVDHIQDLALGGEDHPLNMVALCPNCHAAKTRGAHQARWRLELRRVAAAAHARMVGQGGEAALFT